MKKSLIISLVLVSLGAFANDAKKTETKKNHTKAEETKNVPPQVQAKEKSEEPCQLTQEQLMKQLEEKQKAQAATGKTAPGLQGLGATTGCKVK